MTLTQDFRQLGLVTSDSDAGFQEARDSVSGVNSMGSRFKLTGLRSSAATFPTP